MGSYAFSGHIRHTDATAVARAVEEFFHDAGFVPTEQPPPGADDVVDRRAVQVTQAHGGWVSLLDNDLGGLLYLLADVSRRLETYGLHVFVNDSSSWHYQLFHKGELVDAFDSDGDLDDLPDEWDDEIGEATVEDPEFEKQIQAAQQLLEQQMPEDVRAIHRSMQEGTDLTPAEAQRYSVWLQNTARDLFGQLSGEDFGQLEGAFDPPADPAEFDIEAGEEAEGTSELEDAFDGDALDDDVEYEYESEGAMFPDDELEFDIDHHLATLEPLLANGINNDTVVRILEDESPRAEESLQQFLPLIDIAPSYAHLSYFYAQERTPRELAQDSVEVVRQLCFEAVP